MSNHQTRIGINDTTRDAVMKMCDGNPGAITVLAQILNNADNYDRAAGAPGYAGIMYLLNMDMLGLYGSNIWLLYKDICGENIENTLAVLRANQMGFSGASNRTILNAVTTSRTGRSTATNAVDVEGAKTFLKERLGDDWGLKAASAA